jgi:CxxC-x17-CxxC domain-containing protein
MPTYTPEDLTNLAKYQIYLKLMVDGVATAPFSANTLPPIAKVMDSEDKVIAVSRERYAEKRAVIEEKVLRWSGMETGPAPELLEAPPPVANTTPVPGLEAVKYPAILTEEEQEAREALGGVPASLKPGTPEFAKAGVAALEGEDAIKDTGEYLRISPERLASIVKPPTGQKKDKPKFKHTCSRCGKTWDMPIQLDVSRPMYCAECLPIIREERKMKTNIVKTAVRGGVPNIDAQLVEESPEPDKRSSGLHETMRAMEEGRPVQRAAPSRPAHSDTPRAPAPPPPPNRPRIVVSDREKLSDIMLEDAPADEDRSDLLDDVARTRGRAVETDKRTVVAHAGGQATAVATAVAGKSGSFVKAQDKPGGSVTDASQQVSRPSRPADGRTGGREDEKGKRPAYNSSNAPRIQTDQRPRRSDDRNVQRGGQGPRGSMRPERARGYEVPNRPVIRTSSSSQPSPAPTIVNSEAKDANGRPPKKSLEDLFKEIEDRDVGMRPEGRMAGGSEDAEKVEASSEPEHPTTVFRSASSSTNSGGPSGFMQNGGASGDGAKPLAPGQRIRFDS